jgi:hypothetical protein
VPRHVLASLQAAHASAVGEPDTNNALLGGAAEGIRSSPGHEMPGLRTNRVV